nr:transposase family protein [Naumannella halotolerans]
MGWVETHRANALFDAHRDDPEFGYRFLTGEGKLYLCAVKDAFSNRIAGYSTDSRMKPDGSFNLPAGW